MHLVNLMQAKCFKTLDQIHLFPTGIPVVSKLKRDHQTPLLQTHVVIICTACGSAVYYWNKKEQPSIQTLTSTYPGLGWPDLLLPAASSSPSTKTTKVFPNQLKNISLAWVRPLQSLFIFGCMCLKHTPREVSLRHSNQMTDRLSCLLEMWRSSRSTPGWLNFSPYFYERV